MGLGKTCQLCVHFGALARLTSSDHPNPAQHSRSSSSSQSTLKSREHASAAFLIVCPATVLQHWLKEMRHWAPHMRTVILHSMSVTGGELTKLGNESEFNTYFLYSCTYKTTPLLTFYTCWYIIYIYICQRSS